MNKKLLIFHPTIAPYRIDFFNSLYEAFNTRICLQYRNLKDQKFDYDKIESQFQFKPVYLEEEENSGINKTSIWKQLDEFNPDIVIVNEYSKTAIEVLLYKFIKQRKFKVISMCDDSYNMVTENNDFSIKHRIARSVIVPFLNELILVESRVTEWYKKHYRKGFFFPIIKPDDKARKEYSKIIPESQLIADRYNLKGKKIFLFVGRLVAIKNVARAIEAFSKLNQQENVFVIVGDGPERENLESLSKKLGTNTIFTGRLEGDTLNVWYNVAQIFILPSYLEPFGAVTNEALLAGCLGLISEKAGSQCLIENGINGYTFNPMDTDDIAKKMRSALTVTLPLDIVKLKENKMLLYYHDYINELISFIGEV